MCHVLPCFRGKLPFLTRDATIGKILLSGRAAFRCRHISLQEKQVPPDQKNNFQILIICGNKLSKAELYKSNFVKKVTVSQ